MDVGFQLHALADDETPASLTTQWTELSGPGTVTFEDAAAPATRATFSASGAYTLRLTANDGALTSTLDVMIVVGAPVVPWTNTDVGTVTLPGAAIEQHGQVALTAAGLGLVGTADSFLFRHRELSGDGEVIARVRHLTNASLNGRVGVMLRESTSNGARMAAMTIAPAAISANRTTFYYRSTSSVSSVVVPGIAPVWWLRLKRSGEIFTAYDSPDGVNWTERGTPQTLSIASTALAGIVVSSGMSSEMTSALVDKVRIVGTADNNGPLVDAGASGSAVVGVPRALAGIVTDDALPSDPSAVQTAWSLVSGPGTASFSNPGERATEVTFSAPGNYVLRLAADDGEVVTSDDLTMTVEGLGVTVTASQPIAAEQGLGPGEFTVARTGTAGALTVYFTMGGTATEGSDYAAIGTRAVIPDGSTSTTIPVVPLTDTLAEGPETMILTLTADPGYTGHTRDRECDSRRPRHRRVAIPAFRRIRKRSQCRRPAD